MLQTQKQCNSWGGQGLSIFEGQGFESNWESQAQAPNFTKGCKGEQNSR